MGWFDSFRIDLVTLLKQVTSMIAVYEYTSQPRYWIVHDDDGYWLVPARSGGWDERSPFVGHVMSLRLVVNPNEFDLGIPSRDE